MAASMVCRRALQNIRKFNKFHPKYCSIRHRTNSSTGAYFVFIPEIPKDTPENNAIMRYADYPQFTELTRGKIVRGCAKLALQFDAKFTYLIERSIENPREINAQDVFDTIDKSLAPMNYSEQQATIVALANFHQYPKIMLERIQAQLNRSRTDRYTYNEDIHKVLKALEKQRSSLTDSQKRLLDLYLTESRHRGLGLDGKDLQIVTEQVIKDQDKQVEFLEKVMMHQHLFHLDLGPAQWNIVKELPKHIRYYMAFDKSQPDRGPWQVTLMDYVMDGFIEVCPLRDLRYKVWHSNVTVGTHITTDIRLQTSDIVEDIRECRRDVSQKLGYEHYAEMSMANKMAGSVKTVLSMLDTYRNHFLPMARDELKSLQEFAESTGFKDEIKQWDVPFYRRHQCQKQYNMRHVDRNPYFTFEIVQNKLFSMCEHMFGIKIEQLDVIKDEVNVWHPDVMVFNVYDKDGTYLARFYLDAYSRRDNKVRRDVAEIGRDRCDALQLMPISFIILNINKVNLPGVPALMSYRDVLSYFYQFGNALQQMLTQVPYSEIAGQRNIEWDAAHVSANLLKMFAQQPEVVREISPHYQTGEPLSDAQIDSLRKCQLHMKGFDMCYELYKSAFDIESHLADEEGNWKSIQEEMYQLFMPLPIDKEDWSWCSDHSIWCNPQHSAGYYQYIWSEMLAANIFEEFEEAGMDNDKQLVKLGSRFRDSYLSLGGAVNAKTVFRSMTGRDPSFDSLLKRYPHN